MPGVYTTPWNDAANFGNGIAQGLAGIAYDLPARKQQMQERQLQMQGEQQRQQQSAQSSEQQRQLFPGQLAQQGQANELGKARLNDVKAQTDLRTQQAGALKQKAEATAVLDQKRQAALRNLVMGAQSVYGEHQQNQGGTPGTVGLESVNGWGVAVADAMSVAPRETTAFLGKLTSQLAEENKARTLATKAGIDPRDKQAMELFKAAQKETDVAMSKGDGQGGSASPTALARIPQGVTDRFNYMKNFTRTNGVAQPSMERPMRVGGSEGTGGAVKAAIDQPRTINSQDEYDALPSGATYTDSTGKVKRKK